MTYVHYDDILQIFWHERLSFIFDRRVHMSRGGGYIFAYYIAYYAYRWYIAYWFSICIFCIFSIFHILFPWKTYYFDRVHALWLEQGGENGSMTACTWLSWDWQRKSRYPCTCSCFEVTAPSSIQFRHFDSTINWKYSSYIWSIGQAWIEHTFWIPEKWTHPLAIGQIIISEIQTNHA